MKIDIKSHNNVSHNGLTRVLSKRMYIDGKKDIVQIMGEVEKENDKTIIDVKTLIKK